MVFMFKGLALRPSWPYVGEVARSLLGVLIAIAVALEWGSTAAAIAAGGSAAIAGATALQDSRHGRFPLVLGVSLGMGAAVLIGQLSASHVIAFLIAVVLWCFAAGLVWAVSANAGLVAAAASALLVTSPTGASPRDAITAALLAVGGGLTQAVLVAVWPRQRWHEQKRALADAYDWVAVSARRLATDPVAVLDPNPLIELREAFTLSERQARRRPPAYRGVYGLPERIAMTLNALRAEAANPAVRDVLLSSADALAAVADRGHSSRTDARLALRRVSDSVSALHGPAALAGQRLEGQIAEACALHFTGAAEPLGHVQELRRPGVAGSFRAAWEAVARQMTGDSPILRHAIRLSAAVGVGTAIARFTGTEHGYWIALTVLMVLRPETAHTYTRCVSRVVGNTAGIIVATAVTVLCHPSGLVAAVLAVFFLAVAYAVSGLGYVPLSAALAAAIVFLIDIGGTADSVTLGERIAATLVGGGLAVASHVVLPDRALVRIRQRAGELLKAEIDYAATVIRTFVHPIADPDAALSASWERAARARSAFEAASGGVRADSSQMRRWLTAYRAALNAVTGACATLEVHARATSSPLDRRFAVAVDDYVDAMKGDSPHAGQPWTVDVAHLVDADQQLRDAAVFLAQDQAAQRVLVAETATITRHLLAITEADASQR
jgi:uncharacterized membrane protein YccC